MKPFAAVTVILMAAVAIAHAARVGLGWSVSVGGAEIPMWASIVGLVIAAVLALGLWREGQAHTAVRPQQPGGVNLQQLTGLLNLNPTISLDPSILAMAFPPGLEDEKARERLDAFVKEHNCDLSIRDRPAEVVFRRKT